jgi:hypothetical protein
LSHLRGVEHVATIKDGRIVKLLPDRAIRTARVISASMGRWRQSRMIQIA